MFPADGLPSEVDIAGIVEAYATGLSVVTRCFYDPQALTHGWTVFSTLTSVKLFTVVHSRAPVPVFSSERRHILECIVQAIYSLRVIVEVHNLSGGMIVFHSNSKGTTRLLSSIKYQNVSTALDDHSDVLTELKYQLKHLVRSTTITFKYCDLEAKTGDGIPRQFVSDLGSDFNLHHADLPLPLPELPLENPPHNAVQLYYNGRPLLSKIRSTLRSNMYRASVRVTICKQEGWSTHQFNQVTTGYLY